VPFDLCAFPPQFYARLCVISGCALALPSINIT
jgi:hypothetical protein